MAGKEVEVTVHQALLSSPGHLYAALELGRVHEQTKTVDRTATPVPEGGRGAGRPFLSSGGGGVRRRPTAFFENPALEWPQVLSRAFRP